MNNEGKECPKCKKGTLVFGTFNMYCSENCGHREPHVHGEGPYTCTCGPKLLGFSSIVLNDNAMFYRPPTADKLHELFRLQKEFQETYGYWPDLHLIVSAMMSECGELWNKSGGKWWKKHSSTKEEQTDELVDVLHFFLLACLKLEITPEELFSAYTKKLDVNKNRQKTGY